MNNVLKYCLRLLRLVVGLFLYGLGAVLTIKGNIGYAPYDVLHSGFANLTGMQIGTASIIIGFVFLIVAFIMGERIGLGSILNMLLIGIFVNIILNANIIPDMPNFFLGLLLVFAGLFVISFAAFLYIGAGFCAGPRDSLMVAVRRKTKLPVGVCRTIIEGAATLLGALLGGKVGIGTLISAVLVGVCIQLVFNILKFDPAAIKHENIVDTFNLVFKKAKA